MPRAAYRLIALTFLLAPLIGCQKRLADELVPVQGTLLYKQKPVAGATLCFIPDGGRGNDRGVQATATTSPEGAFSLETYPHGDGIMPGHYKITCVTEPKNTLPRKFAEMTKTPLKIEIPDEGIANLDLHLKD